MWKKILIAILGVMWALWPSVALAADSVNIAVIAQGIVSAGIFNFKIVYVTDTRLDLSWTLGVNVTAVMVRAKYGVYPSDILTSNQTPSDGYLVYSGNGTSVSDTSMNFDENPGGLYYRAWAQLSDGSWVVTPSEGWKESIPMTFLGMLALAGIFSFLGARTSYYILKFLAGGAWVAVGLYWQSSPPSVITAGSSVHVIIMLLFFIFGIAFMFFPFWYSNGENRGKMFAFWRSEEDEAVRTRRLPTMQERNEVHSRRVENALRGRR